MLSTVIPAPSEVGLNPDGKVYSVSEGGSFSVIRHAWELET